MLLKMKCHQNANVAKRKMSQKLKVHQDTNVTKTQISTKRKCHQIANVFKMPVSKKTNIPKTQISQKLKAYKLVRHDQSSLVHINPNGLPGHGLSDSRLVLFVIPLHCYNIM